MRQFSRVPFSDVNLTGEFWSERLEVILSRTIPSQHEMLRKHGILYSLKLPKPVPDLTIPLNQHKFSTQIFWDSDVGKWVEAASYALSFRQDDDVQAKIESIVDNLEAAQAPDGYLNCWYLGREPKKRWTNLRDNHELYCAGHLLEGAVAYYQATGRNRFLKIMERYLEHIAAQFGLGPDQRPGYPGHQEIELAFIRLFHATGNNAHLRLASYFIDQRGKRPHYFDVEARERGEDPADFWAETYEYNQAHLPVREQTKVVGHAVRAMYMYAAMADLAADNDDGKLKRVCEVLWDDITSKRMYVTGGFGPSASNEGFTRDYDLPNDTAYAETCASVAMVFWASRMLNLELDGRYADILETALYNNVLAGLSRDGEHYFYDNVLESDGRHERWAWHTCPCCTMNVSRLVASVGGYFYSVSADTIAVHLYGGAEVTVPIGGTSVKLTEHSEYPIDGRIRIAIETNSPASFAIALRIPAWADTFSASVNGQPFDASPERGYLRVQREWASGDLVELELPVASSRIYPHPAIRHDRGRIALRRGPLVYCFEQQDNKSPIHFLQLSAKGEVNEVRLSNNTEIVSLEVPGRTLFADDWGKSLYRANRPNSKQVTAVAIPYYFWCNRGKNPMAVWLPEFMSADRETDPTL